MRMTVAARAIGPPSRGIKASAVRSLTRHSRSHGIGHVSGHGRLRPRLDEMI